MKKKELAANLEMLKDYFRGKSSTLPKNPASIIDAAINAINMQPKGLFKQLEKQNEKQQS